VRICAFSSFPALVHHETAEQELFILFSSGDAKDDTCTLKFAHSRSMKKDIHIPISYAQAARTEGIRAASAPGVALDAPQKIHPKEEKRVTIKILNKTEAEVIRHQVKEEIIARI
jgi:hypothetical protein